MGALSAIDYAVVVLYLAATAFIGWWVSGYIRTGREFFLAGRTLPWWAVGFSLVATDIGGTDLIGLGGASHRYGIAPGNFDWIGCVPAMIVAAFVFIPHFWRCGITTIPEFLERRFNVAVRTVVSVVWLVFMACNLGVMLLAAGKMMSGLAGWTPEYTIIGVALLVGFYTWSGGLAAVVYTDVLQGVVMIAGCTAVVVIGLIQVGGLESLRERVRRAEEFQAARAEQATVGTATRPHDSGPGSRGNPPSTQATRSNPAAGATTATRSTTTNRAPAASSVPPPVDRFSLLQPANTTSPYPWSGILFGLLFIVSPAYWIGNQAIVQRALGARSEYEAKAGYVWGALLKNVIPLVVVVPGLIAFAQDPLLADPDQALPRLIARTMPVGVKGLFLAAFLAALMSSVDSYLNSATTLVTHDLYLRFVRPDADERRILIIGRLVTIVLTVWSIGWALACRNVSEGVYAIFQTLMSFFSGPAFAVILAGLLSRQATSLGVLVGFGSGMATAVTLYFFNHPAVCAQFRWQPLFQIQDPFLYYSVWAFLMTVVTTAVVSYGGRREPDEKLRYVLGGGV